MIEDGCPLESDAPAQPVNFLERRPRNVFADLFFERVALDEGEMEVGVRCVAVGMPGTAPMAVSVSGPSARMTDDLVTAVVTALHTATERLRKQLA